MEPDRVGVREAGERFLEIVDLNSSQSQGRRSGFPMTCPSVPGILVKHIPILIAAPSYQGGKLKAF